MMWKLFLGFSLAFWTFSLTAATPVVVPEEQQVALGGTATLEIQQVPEMPGSSGDSGSTTARIIASI